MECGASSHFVLSLTQEQMEFIQSSWKARGWDLDVADINEYSNFTDTCPTKQDDDNRDECGSNNDAVERTPIVNDIADGILEDIPGYHIPGVDTADECPWCFCKPCVTDMSNQQLWWETECHLPDSSNSKLRKPHYQRFWVMLLHRGIWNKNAYKLRKTAALKNRNAHAWIGPNSKHPRDIMPDCVLNMVRKWLPNPATVPYMGHKWT